MSLSITQRPETTILDQTSKWNTVRNPLVYKAQRQDFTVDATNDNSGYAQLEFTGVDLTASFTVGDIIYFFSTGVYDAFGEITASTFSGGDTLVTLDIPYAGSGSGFANNDNVRPLYRVEVEIYNTSNVIIGDVHIFSPTTKGYVLIDISEIVKSAVSPDIESDLTGTTEVFTDTTAHTRFYIKYREVWTGSAESQTDDVSNTFDAVTGARQVPSTYGSSLAEYTVFSSLPGTPFGVVTHSRTSVGTSSGTAQAVSPDETGRVKIVTNASANTSPASSISATVNLIFELNSIVVLTVPLGSFTLGSSASQGTGNVVSYLTTADFGSGGFDNYYTQVIINSGAGTYFSQGTVNVYHDLVLAKFLTKFERPVFWRGYPCLISIVGGSSIGSIKLDTGVDDTTGVSASDKLIHFDLNEIIVDQTITSTTIFIKQETSNYVLSETLTVDIVDACANPILLVGRNSLGGVLCWLFDINQEYTFDYGDDRKAKRLLLTAVNLTANRWDALQDFITLGQVYRENIVELTSSTNKTSKRIDQQLYVVDSSGNKIGVVAIPTKNKTMTKKVKHIFEIEIEYPEQF